MYTTKTRIGSPRIIPKVQLSPKIRRKIESPVKIPTIYELNRIQFISNPTMNPETHRIIKINGKTYKKLVKKYNILSTPF